MDWTTANYPYMAVVTQALQYLDDSPAALQLLRDALATHVRIVIVTGTTEDGYHRPTNTVFWNPTVALRLSNGGIMSPAMALIHELAHAVGYIVNAQFDLQYGNTEDRRVIETYENVIAAQLGEPIRHDYQGTPIPDVQDVTYHAPGGPG